MSSSRTKRIALSAVLGALSLGFLYIAAFFPSGRLGMAAAAGLFPAAAVVSCGFSAGFLCYGGTALLALILLSDKSLALSYLLFFGLYPILIGLIEQLRRLPLELVLKLLVFNGIFSVFLFGFSKLFFSLLPAKDLPMGLFYLIGSGIFLIYDFGVSKVLCFYRLRIDRVLRKT